MQVFQSLLVDWYNQNKRTLPWRQTTDPYVVWLSEIILQQTRVDQGLDYFNRFLKKWPTVEKLANADEQDVLKMWQGLGYYSRARNLLTTARQVILNHNGNFPTDYGTLIQMKGIGPYTAAAISSIAGNEPNAVVDGNVYRVLSRFFGIAEPIDSTKGKKRFQALANTLISNQPPGTFNQALMEFGALQCVPKNPACGICVLKTHCKALANQMIDKLPSKKTKPVSRLRYFNYLVFIVEINPKQNSIYLNQRLAKDIWKGMYDFPLIETAMPIDFSLLVKTPEWEKLISHSNWILLNSTGKYKHQLTHQTIEAVFHQVKINGPIAGLNKKNVFLVDQTQFETFPIPRLIDRFIADNKLFRK